MLHMPGFLRAPRLDTHNNLDIAQIHPAGDDEQSIGTDVGLTPANSASHPTVSVVIRTYTSDRLSYLNASIESVLAQTYPPAEIVLVVDHNLTLSSQLRATWNRPEVRVIENEHTPGSSTAWNSGIYAAKGDIIAFIDDDATANPDWLAKLVQSYKDAGVMGVGGTIVPEWQHQRPMWFPEEFDWVVGCTYRGLPDATAPVRNLIGCNMSFRRDRLLAVHGLRVQQGLGHLGTKPIGGDETELCIRLHQHFPPGKILHCPATIVYHHVPEQRATLRYFVKRCYLEGRSKAVISRLSGTRRGLSAEAGQAFRVIPVGILRNLRCGVLRLDRSALARAGMLVVGLGVVGWGYALGRGIDFFTPDRALSKSV